MTRYFRVLICTLLAMMMAFGVGVADKSSAKEPDGNELADLARAYFYGDGVEKNIVNFKPFLFLHAAGIARYDDITPPLQSNCLNPGVHMGSSPSYDEPFYQ